MTKKISQFELTKYILENVNGDTSNLDMKEYTILVSLSNHLNSTTMLCNPSKATLANRCCMGERTVDAAISGLVEKGFVTYVKGGLVGKLRKPNLYTLLFDKIYSCVKTEWSEPTPKDNLIPEPPQKEFLASITKSAQVVSSGYVRHHPNGKVCYSQVEWDEATEKKRIEDMNSMDSPW